MGITGWGKELALAQAVPRGMSNLSSEREFVLNVLRDVTELGRPGGTLRAEKALQQLVELSPETGIEHASGLYLYANVDGRKLRGAALGKHAPSAVHPYMCVVTLKPITP
jgi:hypothetical protein